MNELDFNGLGQHLLNQIRDVLPAWLPGGRLIGHEYCCGDLRGGQGDSCRINVNTGKWQDFATGEKGGDCVSLYAAINSKGQGDAYRELCEKYGYKNGQENPSSPIQTHLTPNIPATVKQAELVVPPPNTELPDMRSKHGLPVASWKYYDQTGQLLFIVARYNTPKGKEFHPWGWNGTRWVSKGWPAPRPLYNLHKLAANTTAPVLICEGEKSCDAAERITGGRYVCTTWPNGARAALKAQWEFIYGRKVLIWPDNDQPGREAADNIARILVKHCPEVKILNPTDQPDGWDAADALEGGWHWDGLKDWSKEHVVKFEITVNDDQGQVSGSTFGLWEKLLIPMTSTGAPIPNVDAAFKLMQGIPELQNIVWFDEFHQRYFTRWNSRDIREWSTRDELELCLMVQQKFAIRRMSDETINKAVQIIANRNTKNEPRDWMDSLVWDGKQRVETFFIDCMGTADTPYNRAASRNFFVALAARIYWPGCQMDNMVIFKGPQGRRKSTLLRVLGGKWYTSGKENILSKDFYLALQGKLIIEIAELDQFDRSQITTIKQVVTDPTDRYRPPYGRETQDFPRQCVFVGTTNEKEILRDHTGGRRFWPVDVGTIDIDRAMAERSQLFAEAVSLYKSGAKWYEMPEEDTLAIQEENRQSDVWEDYIEAWLDSHAKTETTVQEIAHEVLHVAIDKLDKLIQMRIGRCLTALKWEKKFLRRDGKPRKIWVRNTVSTEGGSEGIW